jgi:quercetin dioxygenase-like cupin family protein
MAPPPPSWQNPNTKTWVLRSGVETDGALFEQRVEYVPGSTYPPPHYHPEQTELFEVEQGAMLYMVDGEERRVDAGETLELPPGTVHQARNASATQPAIIRWETRPALRTEVFFRTSAAMAKTGRPTRLERALLAHEYRDVFRLTGPRGSMVPFLAAVARLLGRSLPAPE